MARDYSDLVRSRSAPRTSSGEAPEAHCELFKPAAPANTKLTLRRTKHGWAAASGAASKRAAKHGVRSKHDLMRKSMAMMKTLSAASFGSKPSAVSKTSKSSTVTSAVSKATSAPSTSSASAHAPPAAASAPAASERPEPAAAEDTSEDVGPDVDDTELTARLKRLYSRNRSASSSDARSARADSGSSSGRTDEAAKEDEAAPRFTASVSENGDGDGKRAEKDNTASEGPPRIRLSVKKELSAMLSARPKSELMTVDDEPLSLVYPPPVIAVPKIRLGGPSPGSGAAAPARGAQQAASSSPMLASLLDSTPAPDPARPAVSLPSSEKSCELLKHLLSNSPKESPTPPPVSSAAAPEPTKPTFKLKFHNRDPVTFRARSEKPEPSERTGSPLDPRCKLTPSPVRTPPTSTGAPSGTLWTFLNDPKMGIPELLLIPLPRLKALLSQPLQELANLSTFTLEAVKYVGWHPAFRQVDILQVSRDRLYKLLKDPRTEVKRLLTDPSARLFPLGRPGVGGGGGWGPRGPPPDVAPLAAGRTPVSAPSPSTNSLLRQKLMTRGSGMHGDFSSHCMSGLSAAEQQLLSLLKQPLNKATFLTDEVTIRPISQTAVAAAAPQKRSLPDLIPRPSKRRAPPGLRPLAQPAPQMQPPLPPCPDDSDADDDAAMLAAGLVQACLGEETEDGTDGSVTPGGDGEETGPDRPPSDGPSADPGAAPAATGTSEGEPRSAPSDDPVTNSDSVDASGGDAGAGGDLGGGGEDGGCGDPALAEAPKPASETPESSAPTAVTPAPPKQAVQDASEAPPAAASQESAPAEDAESGDEEDRLVIIEEEGGSSEGAQGGPEATARSSTAVTSQSTRRRRGSDTR
ncbi:flocculation protein FLO11-like [Amphibalanus amphitrite]|uniref:flocculation protein FLO11-like n=1 Tax=Amphibalanus amphitrite TaxID=1232801 RepID=UPI001C924F41|nr:flocculation protein FLO11-like [Amphibalanus amphitrite]